jgi:IMP cyclohydrolase
MTPHDTAEHTFNAHIGQNPYPGRGLVLGRCSHEDGWLLIYFIMGRSSHSRNRRFEATGGTLRTRAVDESKVSDPSLIIYEAMLELPNVQLVSNGDQTRTVCDAIAAGGRFDDALETREREPDAPNYTPRISGMLDFRNPGAPRVRLSLLKANPADPTRTDRLVYAPAPPPAGLGVGLTTYMGDGNPLPSFTGDPLLLPCTGSAEQVLEFYWESLDKDNRISLAVKSLDGRGALRSLLVHNRYA